MYLHGLGATKRRRGPRPGILSPVVGSVNPAALPPGTIVFPYRQFNGADIGMDADYKFALYPNGKIYPVYATSAAGTYDMGGSYVSTVPDVKTGLELWRMGWRPVAADAHGIPIAGVVGGQEYFGWGVPKEHNNWLFDSALPMLVVATLTAGVGASAFGAAEAAGALEVVEGGTGADLIASGAGEEIVSSEAETALQEAAKDAVDWNELGSSWEAAQGQSAVQNVALAEATGQVPAGTLAASVGEASAATALTAAAEVAAGGLTAAELTKIAAQGVKGARDLKTILGNNEGVVPVVPSDPGLPLIPTAPLSSSPWFWPALGLAAVAGVVLLSGAK